MVTLAERRRSPWIWVVLALVALSVAGGLWLAAPQIVDATPEDGLSDAANDVVISVAFNRPMDPASVQDHFSTDPAMSGRFIWAGDEMRFVPSSPWPNGALVHVQLTAGARSRLFLPLLFGRDWSFQVGAPRLIYMARSQGGPQLFGRDLSDQAADRLTGAPLGVLDFAAAEESGDLLYLSPTVGGDQSVHRVDIRTGLDESILPCPTSGCRRIQLSPDGTWLTVEAQSGPQGSPTGPGEVWAAPTDGAADPIRLGDPGHDLRNSLWGPDGGLAVYDSTSQTMLILDGPPSFTLVAQIPNKLGEMGTWSPDGRFFTYPEIIFIDQAATPETSASTEADYYSHLFRYDIRTGQVDDLSGDSSGLIEDASPAYSPDGTWIAFARKSLEPARWTLGRQLWLMRANGSQAGPMTSQPIVNFSTFSWRPDSQVLVYVQSDQTDPSRPTEMGWLDVTTGRTHSLVEGGYAPTWIP
jgi:hypothetical protein